MTDWPGSVSTIYEQIEEEDMMPAIRTRFESGKVQTRSRFTTDKAVFILSWSGMTSASYSALKTFFNTTVKGGGNSFVWTHPSGTTYNMRFADDSLKFIENKQGYYKAKVKLEEV